MLRYFFKSENIIKLKHKKKKILYSAEIQPNVVRFILRISEFPVDKEGKERVQKRNRYG